MFTPALFQTCQLVSLAINLIIQGEEKLISAVWGR